MGEKREMLRRQEAEYRRWQDLHDLIGSHDGARFRNFAQGLTFDAVIALANRQLARMTDRYTLLRAPSRTAKAQVWSWRYGITGRPEKYAQPKIFPAAKVFW